MNVPLSNPDITGAERSAVMEVLSGSRLSLGPKLPEFERTLCEITGARYAVAVNSGTSALHLCVKSAEIGEGDEVVTTPFSFIASANCILMERATPVFADIDPITYNIDPRAVSAAITSRTRAILPVHVFGRPCDMPALLEFRDRHSLHIIEDACEALGATAAGHSAGTLGETGVFAFYPNKQITTGEGGVIVTNDDRIAALCRSWRNQGRSDNSALAPARTPRLQLPPQRHQRRPRNRPIAPSARNSPSPRPRRRPLSRNAAAIFRNSFCPP